MYITQWVNKILKIYIPLCKYISKTIYPHNTGTNHTQKKRARNLLYYKEHKYCINFKYKLKTWRPIKASLYTQIKLSSPCKMQNMINPHYWSSNKKGGFLVKAFEKLNWAYEKDDTISVFLSGWGRGFLTVD